MGGGAQDGQAGLDGFVDEAGAYGLLGGVDARIAEQVRADVAGVLSCRGRSSTTRA